MLTMKKMLAAALCICMLLSVCTLASAANLLKLDQTVTTVMEGASVTLVLRREGAPAEGDVTWKSSNPKAATVDENGTVTGVSKGSTTITASVKTASKTYRATLKMTVQRPVSAIALQDKKLNLLSADDERLSSLDTAAEGLPVILLSRKESARLSVTVEPSDASSKKFTAETDNAEIATVRNETLRAVAPGSCILTVRSTLNPEIEARYQVMVIQPVTRVQLTQEEKTVSVGESVQFDAELTPDDATFPVVNWTSGNEKIATVDEHGLVTGVSRGKCQIKATAADGSGKSATLSITVTQPPESITLSETSMTVAAGLSKTLKATIQPRDANEKSLVWSSTNPNVAKVTSGGKVTGVSAGSCTIYCQSATQEDVSAQCEVTVTQPVTRITFSDTELNVNVGETVQTYWTVEPAAATDASVSFKSSNTRVATIDASGVITGIARGDATITVSATDGSRKAARMTVHVLQPVLGVHMRNDSVQVGVDEELELEAIFEPSNASNRRMSWASEDENIVTVTGNNRHPVIRGIRWGTASVYGITDDGGFETEASVHVGNFDEALEITDLYLQDNQIRISVLNESNMTITRFYFLIELQDLNGNPLPCTTTGTNVFEGSYGYDLLEGDATRHGRFSFYSFVQPQQEIGRVIMTLTGYRTDEGMSWNMELENRPVAEYLSPNLILPEPEPMPVTVNPGTDGTAPDGSIVVPETPVVPADGPTGTTP